jgi:hypothetical protein
MDWYAIQVMTGKEPEVIAALKDHGKEVLQPQRPLFYRRGGNFRIVQNPLFPGYVFVRLEVTDFYKEKRDLRVEGMMIRLCGNWYESVELSESELQFLRLSILGMQPLMLDKFGETIIATNPPPWALHARVDWYAGDKFKAKLSLNIKGSLKNHSFTIAAFLSQYKGCYREQLQDLLGDGFVKRDAAYKQIIT